MGLWVIASMAAIANLMVWRRTVWFQLGQSYRIMILMENATLFYYSTIVLLILDLLVIYKSSQYING